LLQSLPAYDAINMTVVAVSTTPNPHVVWTQMFMAVIDSPTGGVSNVTISPTTYGKQSVSEVHLLLFYTSPNL
jgi:hypothetical protein